VALVGVGVNMLVRCVQYLSNARSLLHGLQSDQRGKACMPNFPLATTCLLDNPHKEASLGNCCHHALVPCHCFRIAAAPNASCLLHHICLRDIQCTRSNLKPEQIINKSLHVRTQNKNPYLLCCNAQESTVLHPLASCSPNQDQMYLPGTKCTQLAL
jgi:hypothetical protein